MAEEAPARTPDVTPYDVIPKQRPSDGLDPDKDLGLLMQELSAATAKLTGSLTTAFTSATVGAALIAAGMFNIPRPCKPNDPVDKCVPAGWNAVYAAMPILAILVAIIVLEAASRYLSLGVYTTDIERHVNRMRPVTITAVDGAGTWTKRPVPSSEQMLGAFVSEQRRRFSIRPLNAMLWISCFVILIAGIAIPLRFIESIPTLVVAALGYSWALFMVGRYAVSLAANPREYTHELWENGVEAAKTSARRHAEADEHHRFLRFLVYPRLLSDHAVKPIITAFGLPAAYFASSDGHVTLAQGVMMWAFIELVAYPIRYQINDIRDRAFDRSHPARDTRGRSRFELTPARERTVARTMIFRVVIFTAFALPLRFSLLWWAAIGAFSLYFVIAFYLYEHWKQHFRENPLNSAAQSLGWRAATLVAVCSTGYGARIGFVFFAAAQERLDAGSLAWLSALVVAIVLSEYLLLLNQWSIEGTVFVRPPLPSHVASSELRKRHHMMYSLRRMDVLARPRHRRADVEDVTDSEPPGHGVEFRDAPLGTSAHRLIPRFEQIARGSILGSVISLSHCGFFLAVALTGTSVVLIGQAGDIGSRLPIFGIMVAALLAVDAVVLTLRTVRLRTPKRKGHTRYRGQPLLSVVQFIGGSAVLFGFAVFVCRTHQLSLRHAGTAGIAVALLFMVVTSSSGSYFDQQQATLRIEGLVRDMRAAPGRMRRRIFDTTDAAAAAGTAA
ncbi:hypothetical protein [Nocardia sp. NPDC057455]|uniref:hypothetical protein n=1 Tax=Nocardia sp. NPDC057455 TaxID=3346138 RepID=UPI00366E44B4